jgi:hypothetical protein
MHRRDDDPDGGVDVDPDRDRLPVVLDGPLGFSLTHGSALAGDAPATIAGQAAKAVAPIVVLT